MTDAPNPQQETAPDKNKAARPSRNRLLKWGGVIVGLIALYALLGFVAAPKLIRSMGQDKLSAALHRPVSIAGVKLNPFTLTAEITGLEIREPGGEGVFVSLDRLFVDLNPLALFRLAVGVDQILLEGPYVHLVQQTDGSYNISDLMAPAEGEAPAEEGKGSSLFPVLVSDFSIRGGKAEFEDKVHNATHTVEGLDLSVPFTSTLPGDSLDYVSPSLSATVDGTPLTMEGRTRPFEQSLRSEFHFNLDKLDLTRFWSYVPVPREARLASGTLSCDLSLVFQQEGENMLPNISLMGQADVDGLSLTLEGKPLLGFQTLGVELKGLSLTQRLLTLGTVSLTRPDASVELGADGALNWMGLVPASPAPAPAVAEPEAAAAETAPAPEAAAAPAEAPAAQDDQGPSFTVTAERLEIKEGVVRFHDAGKDFKIVISPLNVALEGFSTAGGEAAYTLDAGLGEGQRLAASGGLDAMAPASAGTVTLTGFDALAPAPYYAELLPVQLLSCTVGAELHYDYKGGGEPSLTLADSGLELSGLALRRKDGKGAEARLQALSVSGVQADVFAQNGSVAQIKLENLTLAAPREGQAKVHPFGLLKAVQINEITVTAEPLKADVAKIALSGLSVAAPGDADPALALTRLEIAPVSYDASGALLDIRRILLEGPKLAAARGKDGLSNLARIIAAATGEPLAQPEEAPAQSADKPAEAQATEQTVQADQAAMAEGQPQPAGTSVTQMDTKFRLGVLEVRGGSVSFRDESLTPAYSTALKDFAGKLENVSTEPGAPQAALALAGTVDGHAPLIIEGTASPTDIGMNPKVKLTLSNLGLTGFSPYTAKYLSNTLATGQLSVSLDTVVQGRDIASDNVFKINNISLGTYQKSPDDIGVPLSLALALLADRSGNVELDVPVRGNLDDPEFQLGSVIFKAVLNILFKAVTSPFALIGSLVGGGEDLSVLAMTPGTVVPGTDAAAKLDDLAEALAKRPRLKLQVAGTASPAVDKAALTELRFMRALKTPKFLDLQGGKDAPADVDQVTLSDEEYPDALEEAYGDAEFEKETNAFGLTKDQPAEVMEALLRQHLTPTDEDIAELAAGRAARVKDELLARGVDPARVFLRESRPEDAEAMPTGVVLSLQ